MTRNRPLMVRELFAAMADAGIFSADEPARRIIIDLDVSKGAVIMHVERYADKRLLGLVPLLTQAKIITGTPDTQEGTMNDPGPVIPAEEARGGEHPDWANARPGEPLPELPGPGPEEHG